MTRRDFLKTCGSYTASLPVILAGCGDDSGSNVSTESVSPIIPKNATAPVTTEIPETALLDESGIPLLTEDGEYLASENLAVTCDVDAVAGFGSGDVLLLQQHLLGLRMLDANQVSMCDMNHDGQFTVADLLILLQS
jgi:hypothetical protein